MRKVIALNDEWYYKPSFSDIDIVACRPDAQFSIVRLPHTNQELPLHYFDESSYQFHSCYMRKIPELILSEDQIVTLEFEGVMAYTEVFIDGRRVGEHKGGYTPFSIDITTEIRQGHSWLIVHVDSTERHDIPPFGFVVDYLTYGGIYREVQLIIKSSCHLEELRVETPLNENGNFEVHTSVVVSNSHLKDHLVSAQIFDGQSLIAEKEMSCAWSSNYKIVFDELDGLKQWDLNSPNLYRMSILLFDSSKECFDSLECRFGLRTAVFKPDGFYLNGRKLKLRGLNRHQAFPYVGYAMPKSAQYKDAELLKFDLSCNIVRSSHYPPSRHFLDRCDEIGLLVFNEIPGWQHIGDGRWQEVAEKNVEEMIVRDFNHPSIIIWGVRINESADSDAFYEKTNQIAHDLDKTRATGGVRNFAGSKVFEDVYTYNDFIHRGDNIALERRKDIAKIRMPYLVTEHNGHMFPTKSFDSESKRIEHALRHARVLNAAYAAGDISGAIGWCMSDYNTHKDFGSGDRICYHGVMDIFRIPKYAAAVYASQSDDTPYMNLLSSMFVGDFDASELGKIYAFTNCESIKVYKNGRFINQFYPDKTQFADLPHPPIIIDDLIGDMIEKNERFSTHDAKTIKKILLKFVESGSKLPWLYKLQMLILFIKYKMNFGDAAHLYGKYIASWGEKSTLFRFEGYKAGKICAITEKDASKLARLTLLADSRALHEMSTYDVTRVVVKYADCFGNPYHYANWVVKVRVEGPIEIIGPSEFALIGGVRAFWVKTTGILGTCKITVSLENGELETVEIDVI